MKIIKECQERSPDKGFVLVINPDETLEEQNFIHFNREFTE